MLFWSLAIAMLLLALLLLLPSLLGRGPHFLPPAQDSNLVVYRQRLTELERDHNNGQLDAEQFRHGKLELEHALLDDVPPTAYPAPNAPPARLTPVQPAWMTVALLTLLLPITALTLYAQLGDPKQALAPPDPVAAAPSKAAGMHSVDDMVARLASRLQQQPADPQGWMMLGRSYVTLGRAAEATLAFARAFEQTGEQPQLMADYAEALALANGDSMAGQPEQLAARALALEPANQKALWLAGVAALQNNDTAAARKHWGKLLALLPAGSTEAQTLNEYLAQMKDVHPDQIPKDQTAAAVSLAGLEVAVALAPELAAQAPAEASVFIFARAANGPRMPLAVARRQVRDLPATVRLDDSSAMTPELTLSRFAEVVVGARISLSGSANVSSGDLQGLSAPVRPDAVRSVQLTINERAP